MEKKKIKRIIAREGLILLGFVLLGYVLIFRAFSSQSGSGLIFYKDYFEFAYFLYAIHWFIRFIIWALRTLRERK